MPKNWFANRGQMIQTGAAALGLFIAGRNAWSDLLASRFLSVGALLFYVLVGLVALSFLHAARRSAYPLPGSPLTLIDAHATVDHSKTYPVKEYVELRNDTDDSMAIRRPRWIESPGGVRAQSPLGSSFLVERMWNRRLGPWEEETTDEIWIHPRQRLLTWIGLEKGISETEVNERHRHGRLGTLAFVVRIRGREIEQRIQL